MRFAAASLAMAAVVLSAPVYAQVESREGIALQNQIYQLRQELRAYQEQGARGAAASGGSITRPQYAPQPQYGNAQPNDLLAQLLGRVDALEDQVRQLRGKIDELQNQTQRQRDELNKKIDDLAFQVTPPAAQPGPAPGLTPTPVPPPVPKGPRTADAAIKDAEAALARRDYAAAESAAREVLANRTSPRGYDARLLLAQALAGQKHFDQAALAYDDTYNASRKGPHAQDALLGVASSLSALGEKKAACDTLTRLRADFPSMRSEIASGASAVAQKAGCR
jgi:TolA-binding protein